MEGTEIECTFAVVGGGIAGVSCIEGLGIVAPKESVVLVTTSPLIKLVTNIMHLGKTLMQFDVEERNIDALAQVNKSSKVLQDTVIKVNSYKKLIETESGKIIHYKKLCLCNGARPKLIEENNKFVIGIRDTESVVQFSNRIASARKIVVVGNGGIATEIVHAIEGIEIVWVIKDKHISATFVDSGAAEFFLDKLNNVKISTDNVKQPFKRIRYSSVDLNAKGGPALGPDWHNSLDIKGNYFKSKKIQFEYECEITDIFNENGENTERWPVYAKLTNGKIIGCDFIVSATGVIPNSNIFGLENLQKGEDTGFLVNWQLQTSEKDIYAAGDVCTAGWPIAEQWFQMRLWTQARQMGCYAAKSMALSLNNEEFLQDFCFELFTHTTKFFGFKVVLLGLYNAQKLDNDYEILLRMTKGQEYIKLVLKDGKMQGAVLIGDTDLEEMCENLILNQLDLSIYGEDLLNPDIDIEDYFD